MLEITTKKRRWPKVLASFIILLIIAIGGYVIITIMSPDMPVLSGKAPNATAEKLTKPGGTYGDRLFLPQLNIDIAIVKGNDSSALDTGAWHKTPENGDPIEGGNFALSAHRFIVGLTPQITTSKSPFYNLSKLKKGDKVYVDYQGKRYQYEITKTSGIGVKEVESASDDAKLTLYARSAEGDIDGRNIIEAKLTPGQQNTSE